MMAIQCYRNRIIEGMHRVGLAVTQYFAHLIQYRSNSFVIAVRLLEAEINQLEQSLQILRIGTTLQSFAAAAQIRCHRNLLSGQFLSQLGLLESAYTRSTDYFIEEVELNQIITGIIASTTWAECTHHHLVGLIISFLEPYLHSI